MKLATLKDGQSRDGILCLVSASLKKAVKIMDIASTLQQALDHWPSLAESLQTRYNALNDGTLEDCFDFDETQTLSPLPRAYQWADGSAYVNHVELVRKARGAEMPQAFWTDPLMYQGGSDTFIGPYDDILVSDEAYGIDFEAEIAVITDEVPMGVSPENALSHVALIMLVNDVSLRNLIPAEIAKGFGFFHAKPSSSFSPIALSPDELGHAWKDGKLHRPLHSYLNKQWFGSPEAGENMTFSFAQLIAHAAKTRRLAAGTIIGSGTVSNVDRSKGSSCIAEKRMLEILDGGKPLTPFMQFGDSIRIEMFDDHQHSIFGAINQTVKRYSKATSA